MSTATVEPENPDVDPDENLPAAGVVSTALIERWLAEGPDAALQRVETLVNMLDKLRKFSIRATYPPDWIIHTSVDSAGAVIAERGYLQDSGAQRAGSVWGIEVGNPAIECEQHPDGTFSYHMIGEAWSKVTGERLEYVEGSRWSGDPFFKRSVGADDKIDPTDVRKSAYSNLHGRAVRQLAGLNGVPVEQLREAGIDVTKVVNVTYAKGAKGGTSEGASVGTGTAQGVAISFGKSKGKRASELSVKDLAWYVKAVGESVADPEKAAYKDRNQKLLDGLEAEVERRKHPEKVPAGGGASAGETAAQNPPDAASVVLTRGQRCSAVFKRLSAYDCRGSDLMQALVGKGSLSDVSDEELARLESMPDAEMEATAKALQERE